MGSAFQARITVRNPRCWAASISKDLGTRVEISAFKGFGNDAVRQVATIEVHEPGVQSALDAVGRLPSVARFGACGYVSGRLVLVVDVKHCAACLVAARSESIVVRAAYEKRGDLEWTVFSADAASLRSLLLALREKNCPAEIAAAYPIKGNSELTIRQREVLSAAVGMGYFDEPRRIDLHDLALKFGISRVAARELLRKAERKLLRRFL